LCKIGNNHFLYIAKVFNANTCLRCVRTNLISVTQRESKKLKGEVLFYGSPGGSVDSTFRHSFYLRMEANFQNL
jgi:hypothetical protein